MLSPRPRRSKSALVLLMLFSLLLQVQTVFACQIDENMSGEIEHCCCDDGLESTPMSSDDSCCDYSGVLEFSGIDPDDRQSAIIDFQALLKLPPAALHLLYELLPERTPSAVSLSLVDTPSLATVGRHTYLSTLRLRI